MARRPENLRDGIEERKELKEIKEVIGFNVWRKRLDIAQNKWWDRSASLIKDYLIARACDIVRFGKEVADVTLPQPDVNGATTKQVTEFVTSLVEMVRHKEKYREWPNYVPKLVLPEHLDARVLSRAEAHAVREACLKELRAADIQSQKVARTMMILPASALCLQSLRIISIKVRNGQYVEKRVRERTEIDMVNEAARLLSSVEPHSAYVRFEKKEGGTGAWTGKVRMEKLVGVGAGALAGAHEAIKPAIERYTRPRERIRREIEERQKRWRASAVSGPQNAPLPAGKGSLRPAVPSGTKLTAPPPTRTKDRLPRDR